MKRFIIRRLLKDLLSRHRLFLRIRYSDLFLRIWFRRRPAVRMELAEQKRYYEMLLEDLLPGIHRAFDIGANEGFVSAVLLGKGLFVTALDPDPRNARILEARYQKNKKFSFYPFAAGERAGSLPLYRQKDGTALSTLEPKWKGLVEREEHRLHSGYEEITGNVNVVTLDELIGEEKPPCLIKVDVEGYERSVLRGLSRRVPLLTFEANLPEFLPETLECLDLLFSLDPDARFNYSTDFRYGLEDFIDYPSFRAQLPAINHSCIDVICRMSNYSLYYRTD
jgi:FkbM family methyltransferase